MEITVQYVDGCPNWKTTAGHLARLIEEGLDGTVSYERVDSHERALARGFSGSPTVLINGIDAFANAGAPVGLACRVYPTQDGYAVSPTLSQLQNAIAKASKE